MNLHEYQAKDVFRTYGIPVPAGRVAQSPEEAVERGGDARRIKLGREGAGSRRRPRQGGRRQAGA